MKSTLATLALGLAGVFSAGSACANLLTLQADNSNTYQQGVQNPCIFSNSSCTGTLPSTPLNQGGNTASYDAFATYSGSTLLNLIGTGALILGIDINEAKGQGPQTLTSFELYKNNVLTDTYTGTRFNVGATSNGNGYADYILSGFSTFLATDSIKFHFVFNDANDGTENVFLATVSGPLPPVQQVPEPATLALFGMGLLGLGFARKKLM